MAASSSSELAKLVAVPSESEKPRGAPYLAFYLTGHMRPMLEKMGFVCEVLVNPALGGPLLLAERVEDPDLPTVLIYGHGDVVRGLEGEWSEGLGPWRLVERMGRVYGRGVADNKGQHLINLAALRSVLAERGRLGFNAKFLLETGGEIGSPGLSEICSRHRDRLVADLLLASAGTRIELDRPTLFLGSRGVLDFDLVVDLREHGQHAGNWGGLLANPAVLLAHAVATIISASGAIRIPALRPRALAPALQETARRDAAGDDHRRAGDRCALGRAGPQRGREAARLEQLRGARLDRRQPAQPHQRHPAARRGALPDPLHGRQRSERLPAGDPVRRCAMLACRRCRSGRRIGCRCPRPAPSPTITG